MRSSHNCQYSPKQKHTSPRVSSGQSMKEINNQKLKKLGKCFRIVDSPEIVFDLCDKAYIKSRQSEPSTLIAKDHVQITKNLLEEKRKFLQRKGFFMNRTSNHNLDPPFQGQTKNNANQLYSTSFNYKLPFFDDRKFYQTIRDRLKELVEKVQNQTQIMISEVMVLKQDILSSFFSQIIEQSKRQCKEKGQLIHYIWNSMFSILELALTKITKQKNHNQKHFLTQTIENHKNYQDMLQYDKQKIITLKQELHKALVFKNTLVFNLRCKRRQLRKSYIKLKICTNKLNQYKNNFLDLQRQHINLIMQTRDVSKQMAEFLFKRRQQILQDKKKNFKLKFSKKANFQNTKNQIQKQPIKELQLINDQLNAAFYKQYEREMTMSDDKKLKKLTNFLFEDATDQFAFYENTDCMDDDLMAQKMQTTFVDAQTDMVGFEINAANKDCQTDYVQKIVNGLIKNNTAQTIIAQEKPKKIFCENQTQISNISLDQLKYQVQSKVYDMSFLFEGKRSHTKKLTISKYLKNKQKSFQRNNRTINQDQSSTKSIKFSSKKSLRNTKTISNKISQNSQFYYHQDDSMNQSLDNNSQSKTQFHPQKHTKKQLQISDQQNSDVVDFVSKFALKKVFPKKTKNTNSLGFQSQRYSSQNKAQVVTSKGFIKTNKTSRFSRLTQRMTKNLVSSLQVSPLKSRKKNYPLLSTKRPFQQQKKQLKRVPIQKRQNDVKIQSKIQAHHKKTPLNSNIMKLLTKTIKEHVNTLNKKDLLSKFKVENLNDQQMLDFIKQKGDEDKQQFFKNFSESISPLITDLNKNIESTKKYHKVLLPARQKNLFKIISNVYMQAYQLLQKKQKLYSLINPIFKFFQMGYGMLKKYDLYSRMISFLSNVCIHKQESYILYSFYFFTAIDRENQLSLRVTSQDFELYLKLLKNLSFNFNVNGLNVQNLFTSNLILEKNTRQVLIEEKMSEVIIEKVLSRVKQKLQRLSGVNKPQTFFQSGFPNKFTGTFYSFSQTFSRSQSQSGWKTLTKSAEKKEDEQIKLDVFKCCQFIMEEIIMIRKSMEESYLPLITYVYEEEQNMQNIRIDELLVQFIIRCQFKQKVDEIKSYQGLNNIFKMNSLYNQYKVKLNSEESLFKSEDQIKTYKAIRTLKSIKFIQNGNQDEIDEINEKETISLNEICTFFLKTNVFDLNKTYYNALSIFKFKQSVALNICIKRLPEIKKFFQKENLRIQMILLQEITENDKIDNFISIKNQISYEPINADVYRNFIRHNRHESFIRQKDMFNGSALKVIHDKKILILCFLRFLQSQVNQTIEDMLGQQLQFLHNFNPINKIKT